jgi:hypothetical protein
MNDYDTKHEAYLADLMEVLDCTREEALEAEVLVLERRCEHLEDLLKEAGVEI